MAGPRGRTCGLGASGASAMGGRREGAARRRFACGAGGASSSSSSSSAHHSSSSSSSHHPSHPSHSSSSSSSSSSSCPRARSLPAGMYWMSEEEGQISNRTTNHDIEMLCLLCAPRHCGMSMECCCLSRSTICPRPAPARAHAQQAGKFPIQRTRAGSLAASRPDYVTYAHASVELCVQH